MTVRIIQGDAIEQLRTLPDNSVNCCVTSPPYFGLRSYLPDGHPDKAMEIGSEPTPDEFVAALVAVFREVRRVLRSDGSAWINLGDSYAGSRCGPQGSLGEMANRSIAAQRVMRNKDGNHVAGPGAKSKNLLMIPARVAIALQEDGWWLRQQLPWVKRNPMPESAKSRPTCAVEYIFQLTKSGSPQFWRHRDLPGVRSKPQPDYRWIDEDTGEERSVKPADSLGWRRINLWSGEDCYYDYEGVKRAASESTHARLAQNVQSQVGSDPANGGRKTNGPMKAVGGAPKQDGHSRRHAGFNERYFGERKLAEPGCGIKNNQSMDAALSIMPSARALRNSDFFFDSLAGPLGAITDNDGLIVAFDVTTQGYSESHFATFPPKLVEPIIRASTSEAGCCSACGAPWVRIVERGERDAEWQKKCGADVAGGYTGQSTKDHDGVGVQNASDVKRRILERMRKRIDAGWLPSCGCDAGAPIPCVVLDPFAGAFTTPLVADRLQRDAIGIELNSEYCEMARRRVSQDAPLLAEIE